MRPKIKKFNAYIQVKIEEDIKLDAEKYLYENYNKSMSDFLREALYDFVKKEERKKNKQNE